MIWHFGGKNELDEIQLTCLTGQYEAAASSCFTSLNLAKVWCAPFAYLKPGRRRTNQLLPWKTGTQGFLRLMPGKKIKACVTIFDITEGQRWFLPWRGVLVAGHKLERVSWPALQNKKGVKYSNNNQNDPSVSVAQGADEHSWCFSFTVARCGTN